MAAIAGRLSLRPNEFAFHFETDNGVAVDVLATFLRRAATVARSQGADLRVVGVRAGSLAVILAAVRKSAAREFGEKPIDTTIKASGFVVAIVAAIVTTMSPATIEAPLRTTAVELVDRHEVTQITIVTSDTETVLMNKEISRRVREAWVHERRAPAPANAIPGHISQQMSGLDKNARRGDLSGEVLLVGEDLHFRPDGYKFLVPVDTAASHGIGQLLPSRRYRVTGYISTQGGQPDHIVVHTAVPL